MAEMVYPKICSYRPSVWICFLITLYLVETNAHSKIKVGIEHRQKQISRERNEMQDDPGEIRHDPGWIFVEESESNEDRRNKGVQNGKIGTSKVDRARRNEKKNAAKGNKHHEEDLFGETFEGVTQDNLDFQGSVKNMNSILEHQSHFPSIGPSPRSHILTEDPSLYPTRELSDEPTRLYSAPSYLPSSDPSISPTLSQSLSLSLSPSSTESENLRTQGFIIEKTLFPTQSPTSEKSHAPSYSPSSNPSNIISSIPTNMLSNNPSTMFPTPNIIRRDSTLRVPKLTPPPTDIFSNAPSAFPSPNIIQQAMKIITRQTVEISPFSILVSIDTFRFNKRKFRDISELHLTTAFLEFLPSSLNFESLSLEVKKRRSWGSRIDEEKHSFLLGIKGEADFLTSEKVEEKTILSARMRAFDVNGMQSFLSLLQNHGFNTSTALMVTDKDDLEIDDEIVFDDDGSSDTEWEDDDEFYMVDNMNKSEPVISEVQSQTDQNDLFVKVGTISFAIAGVALMLAVGLVYKVVKRMRENQNENTVVVYDNDAVSQTCLESKSETRSESKSIAEQHLFSTSHSIFQITEEGSYFDDEHSSKQSSRHAPTI